MQSRGNIRAIETLRYLYQQTDESHPATVTDITAYLKEQGIQAVRQTVYADLNALIHKISISLEAGFLNTQN